MSEEKSLFKIIFAGKIENFYTFALDYAIIIAFLLY